MKIGSIVVNDDDGFDRDVDGLPNTNVVLGGGCSFDDDIVVIIV